MHDALFYCYIDQNNKIMILLILYPYLNFGRIFVRLKITPKGKKREHSISMINEHFYVGQPMKSK